MATGYTCIVNQVGPTTLHSDTPAPEIALNLTDVGGSFSDNWFFAAASARNQMLAVALAAVSTQLQVSAWVDPPNANNTPWTQCYELRVMTGS
jgi:hypothetical protein